MLVTKSKKAAEKPDKTNEKVAETAQNEEAKEA